MIMDKKELIESIAHLPSDCSRPRPMIDKLTTLELIKLLDEPQKVTVPQYVTDWIERSKQEKRNLRNALNNGGEKMRLWFLDLENYDTFARAWLDGYEIEKEKRYMVKIKGVACPYLNHDTINELWFYNQKIEGAYTKTQHTRKELEEANFGWVFDCPGIEIEEVE